MPDETLTGWTKSSYSGSGNACVEWTNLPVGTAVRDSKLGDVSPVLRFTGTEWSAFTAGVRAGEFD